ncbi:MAG TPA: heparan-alpha-glucosaminide N-acetyltransferase [Methanothrix sp.]
MDRFWEVDFLRGWAIVMMVLFHMVFDLNYFGIRQIDVNSGFWFYLARFTALLFLLLVGVSLTLSHSRAQLLGQEDRFRLRLMKRSLWIFGLAMGVTLVTYFFIREGFIVFGVLHLISVSLLLAYPFLRLNGANFIFGLLFILVGLSLQSLSVDFPWLLWLGLAPWDFRSVDYFPLLPWFGVILVGAAFGDLFYRGYRRRVPLPDLTGSSLVKGLEFLGRNSLAIYLAHQPVIIGLMYLGGVRLPWQ